MSCNDLLTESPRTKLSVEQAKFVYIPCVTWQNMSRWCGVFVACDLRWHADPQFELISEIVGSEIRRVFRISQLTPSISLDRHALKQRGNHWRRILIALLLNKSFQYLLPLRNHCGCRFICNTNLPKVVLWPLRFYMISIMNDIEVLDLLTVVQYLAGCKLTW